MIFLLVMLKYEGGDSSSGVSPKWVKSRRFKRKREIEREREREREKSESQ